MPHKNCQRLSCTASMITLMASTFYKKIVFQNSQNYLFSLPQNGSERNSESLLLICVLRNGIPSCFLFRWRVRNRRKGFPRVCFFICSTERNSELFSLSRKDSEGNSESFLQNCRNFVGNNHLFCPFRLSRNFLLSEIPNLSCPSNLLSG